MTLHKWIPNIAYFKIMFNHVIFKFILEITRFELDADIVKKKTVIEFPSAKTSKTKLLIISDCIKYDVSSESIMHQNL